MKNSKKLIVFFVTLVAMFSCKQEKELFKNETLKSISKKDLETAIIYEANIRQYSPEGTFNEFTKDIPKLKELGVKIIWLMPIFPISETKRKAEGNKFASEFPEEEQSKYLGSYYAVSDFMKINPEFGTIEDFRELVKTAHQNGLFVILDWVPNHTGWNHIWLTTDPDFYTKNEKGEVIHPEDTDWTDVADLNYDNVQMQKTMISNMKHWVVNEDIDGFRCDVAGSVPVTFWQKAIPQLREEKNIFMLAEAWEPELLKENLFDMAYAWDGHHLMNAIAKKEKNISDLKEYITKTYDERYEKDDILMNFVTNHDENSWKGSVKERMGNHSEMMTALSYIFPGMPLIYSGQEYDLNHRLKFFEKDSIPKATGKTWDLLKKLGKLKSNNIALHGGKEKAGFQIINSEKEILILERFKNEKSILFIANLADKSNKISIDRKGKYLDLMTENEIKLNGDAFEIGALEFKIFTK